MEYTSKTKLNKIFYLSLPANYTTGYTWNIVDMDKSYLEYLKTDYIPMSKDLVGSSGVAQLNFRAIKRGETILKLSYGRIWEDTGDIDFHYINII